MLPKANPERRLLDEPIIRVFDNCPDCGKYIAPGFRTDCCPFCWADFSETPEYKGRNEDGTFPLRVKTHSFHLFLNEVIEALKQTAP